MAETALSHVLTASSLLTRAGQWEAAAELLRATHVTDPDEDLRLKLALAEVTVDQDFAQRTDYSGSALTDLSAALAAQSDPVPQWDAAMLALRKRYSTHLFATFDGDSPAPDSSAVAQLAAEAERLQVEAADDSRRSAAAFYRGLIDDNLRGQHADAFKHYTGSLALSESANDDLQASYAFRDLGDHAHTAGDLTLARTYWERSTEIRQREGHLLGALAQQVLLATLTRDEGNPTAAKAIAAETNRWARQLNLHYVVAQTAELLQES
ncbi:hypothetical protein Kfla_4269 [Kribbella flavida DSM 17836]|uniref:Uncharacterized protein n=1 Tax=Kribbella flavida (strain DSM 17836 / JCM 10339 / NBRC 14399) TaxID=479435 RepID=D2PU21_KRIFD|nr:hypothetical protein [Kribbella flavida]ADB33304.1 hypothetical protein Kfla_4269 [Kribbella flavida DSM 17836]